MVSARTKDNKYLCDYKWKTKIVMISTVKKANLYSPPLTRETFFRKHIVA